MPKINNVGGSGSGGGLADAARALLNFFRGRSTRAAQANEHDAISPRTQITQTQATRSNQTTPLSERDIEHGASKKRRILATAVRAIVNFFRGRSALKIDRSSISKKEVDAIMPHLFSPSLGKNRRLYENKENAIYQAKMDADKELKNLSESGNGLTRDELQALHDYIDSPVDINQKIKDSGVRGLIGKDQHQYEQMMSGLNKLSDHPETVYRSTMMSPKNMRNFKNSVGDLVASKAFLSTAIGPTMYRNVFSAENDDRDHTGNIQLRVQIIQQSGKNISGIDDAFKMSNDPDFKPDINLYCGEGEIVIQPNTRFRLAALDKHPWRNIYGAILREVDSPKPSDNVRDRQGAFVEQKPASAKGLDDEFVKVIDSEQSVVDDS